jgi:three-Cys-motif partner protein
MIKKDYWNIRPPTERKLEIYSKYLNAWATIIFSQFGKLQSSSWQTPFVVDCFAGRGMYHKNDKADQVKGSPLIACELLLERKRAFEEKARIKIFPKIRLIEHDKASYRSLQKFIGPFTSFIDIKLYNEDFNNVIGDIVAESGYAPAFFFVDAGGIKELKSESVETIVSKKGARDILLNYIVDGPTRIGGLAQSVFDGTYKGKNYEKAFRTIEQLEDFTGTSIYDYLEKTNNEYREALLNYVRNVIHANNKLARSDDKLSTIVYDMKDINRQRLVYYLLFSSRKKVASDIMKQIFKDVKKRESSQQSLFDVDIQEIRDR